MPELNDLDWNKLYRSTTEKLKRHYKLSGSKIDVFWQSVWKRIVDNKELKLDVVIREELKKL